MPDPTPKPNGLIDIFKIPYTRRGRIAAKSFQQPVQAISAATTRAILDKMLLVDAYFDLKKDTFVSQYKDIFLDIAEEFGHQQVVDYVNANPAWIAEMSTVVSTPFAICYLIC